MDEEKLIKTAIDCGAAKAAVIPGDSIVLSSVFRDICRGNGCGNYGKCWMCPPDVGGIEELMAKVRSYSRGLLYQTIAKLEDSFDIEGMTAAGREHMQVSQRIQAALADVPGERLHLSCGGCRLCESCAKREDKPCRHPELALASMESCGIDVYNTTKDTGLKYINGQNTVTFFGIVLFNN